jgi:hypothetical protein
MSSYGVVRDLFDDGYLQLEDIVHNVQPFPTLVPYDDYDHTILVYKTEADLDVVMGQIQSFTDRVAQGYKKELWTWVVQLKVDDLPPAHSAKKLRLTPSYPSSMPEQPWRSAPLSERKPGYMTAGRRTFDGSLLQQDLLLRALFNILGARQEWVPNLVEFLYQFLDAQCGDGYGLLCAAKREIPSLNDFERQPVWRTTGIHLPTAVASERVHYQERTWGLQPPRMAGNQNNMPPPNTPAYFKYIAACFKARDAAKRLLHEAGLTERQMANFACGQKTPVKDTEEKPGPFLTNYLRDRAVAIRLSVMGNPRNLPRLSNRGNETELVEEMEEEARQAPWFFDSERAQFEHLTIPAPIFPPTPASAFNSNINGPGCIPNSYIGPLPDPERQLFSSSAAWAPSISSLLLEPSRPPASNADSQQDGGDASNDPPAFDWDAPGEDLPRPLGFDEATGQWNFGRWAGFSGDELGDVAPSRPRPPISPMPPWLIARGPMNPTNVYVPCEWPEDASVEERTLSREEWEHLKSLSREQLESMFEFVGDDMKAAFFAVTGERVPWRLDPMQWRQWRDFRREDRPFATSPDPHLLVDYLEYQDTSSQAQAPQIPDITITSAANTSNPQVVFPPQGHPQAQSQQLAVPGPSQSSNLTPGIHGLSVSNTLNNTIPLPPLMPPPIFPPPTLPALNYSPPRQGISRSKPPTPIKTDAIAKLAAIGSPVPPAAIHKGIPVLLYYPSIVVHHPIDYLNADPDQDSEKGIGHDKENIPDPDPPTDAIMLGYLQADNSHITLTHALFVPTILRQPLQGRVARGGYRVLESYSAVARGKAKPFPEFGGLSCAHECAYDRLSKARALMMQFESTGGIGGGKGKGKGKVDDEPEMGMGMDVDSDSDTDMVFNVNQRTGEPTTHPDLTKQRESLLTKRWRVTPGISFTGERGAIWEGWALVLDRGLFITGAERSGALRLVDLNPPSTQERMRLEAEAGADPDRPEYDSDGLPIDYDSDGNRLEYDSDGNPHVVVPDDEDSDEEEEEEEIVYGFDGAMDMF